LGVTWSARGASASRQPAHPAPPLTLAADTRSVRQPAEVSAVALRRWAMIRTATALAIAVLVGAHVTATANVVHVPADQPTIQAGIDAASAGDTVVVACGVYEEWGMLMKSGVHLTSETGSPECVTIDGLTLGRILWCEDVGDGATISGLTIAGGRAGAGAGVLCKRSELLFERVIFRGNLWRWARGRQRELSDTHRCCVR
jgi:hypothetical protein